MTNEKYELLNLSKMVQQLIEKNEYETCEKLIIEAMKKYPHAPEPHNLFGMLLEFKNNHLLGMKHFRVAFSLDPTYIPARYNLELYGTSMNHSRGAFDEFDIPYNRDQCSACVMHKKGEFRGINHEII